MSIDFDSIKRITINGQELIEGPIDGYKIFNEGMTCRDVAYLIGINELGNNNPLEMCGNGIHFCQYPSGVWSYYGAGRVFKILAWHILPKGLSEPGSDKKLVCRKIEILEEVIPTGDQNTGHQNTGNRNTGHLNTGDQNTGDQNTGDQNTGHQNTGSRNTGHLNTGDQNTGHLNTGSRNTGDWNTGDRWSGYLNLGDAPVYVFNKIVKPEDIDKIDHQLIYQLGELLRKPEPIHPTPFLSLPNASKAAIKRLHKATLEALARLK